MRGIVITFLNIVVIAIDTKLLPPIFSILLQVAYLANVEWDPINLAQSYHLDSGQLHL